MERSIRWLLVGARVLLAVVFLLNGFGTGAWNLPAVVRTFVVCVFGSRYVCLALLLAGGWHAAVSRAADQFFQERCDMGWAYFHRRSEKSALAVATD